MNYIDVSQHPLTIALEKNWNEILNEFFILSKEFLGFKQNNMMGSVIDQRESNGKKLYTGKIRSVFTRVAPESCSISEYNAAWGNTEQSKIEANQKFIQKQKLTPVLESILSPHHPYIGTVGFNLMSPNTTLSMHYGMISKYIRFHLGLIVDPSAKFIVNNTTPRAWECGKVWAFDDGLSYHGTIHDGILDRLILLIDVERDYISNIKEENYQ